MGSFYPHTKTRVEVGAGVTSHVQSLSIGRPMTTKFKPIRCGKPAAIMLAKLESDFTASYVDAADEKRMVDEDITLGPQHLKFAILDNQEAYQPFIRDSIHDMQQQISFNTDGMEKLGMVKKHLAEKKEAEKKEEEKEGKKGAKSSQKKAPSKDAKKGSAKASGKGKAKPAATKEAKSSPPATAPSAAKSNRSSSRTRK